MISRDGLNLDDPFNDPLNIRNKGGRPAGNAYQVRQASPQQRPAPAAAPPKEPVKQEESENPITGFFWWMLAGGKDCCSMRERKTAQEATKGGTFPEPITAAHPVKREDPSPSTRRAGGADSDSEESIKGMSRHSYQPEAARQSHPPGPLFTGPSSQAQRAPERQPSPQPPAAVAPRSSPPPAAPAPAPASYGPVGGGVPPRWEWPNWCLDAKNPVIQVYVVDDETGRGKWCEAEPMSRVVDKSGRDAYLSAEYEWEHGEVYVQDFGPQHVRRRGETQTVIQLFEKGQQRPGGSSFSELDQTRLAPGRGRGDNGAGVSAYLGNR